MKSVYAPELGTKFAFINSMRRSFFVLSGPLNPLSGPLYQFGVGFRLNPNRGVKISKIFISSSYSPNMEYDPLYDRALISESGANKMKK